MANRNFFSGLKRRNVFRAGAFYAANYPRALDYLEQASATDPQWTMHLKVYHVFDSLRTEPRFIALMKKCHFDQ